MFTLYVIVGNLQTALHAGKLKTTKGNVRSLSPPPLPSLCAPHLLFPFSAHGILPPPLNIYAENPITALRKVLHNMEDKV